MAGLFKNIVGGISGLVNAAAASVNPYKVQVVNLENYRGATVSHLDVITLYKRPGCYECILSNPIACQKTFSLFRLTNEGESYAQFSAYSSRLCVIASCSSSVYLEDVLQRLCDCVREHPTWTSAHVAAYVGLFESFKHSQISTMINMTCTMSNLTTVMAAILGKQVQCVQELLMCGASIQTVDRHGNTPYHYAVDSLPAVISVLSGHDHVGVVNWLNGKGETALLLACQKMLSEAVEMLLHSGADPSVTGCELLPVHAATKAGDIKSLELICKKHPKQLSAQDGKFGGSPLHWAETVEVVELLCRMGCDVNAVSNTGHSALQIMLQEQRLECVMELLCFGVDTRIPDGDGNTPLHWAIQRDDAEMVRTLVVFGADVGMRNSQRQTARHLVSVSKGKNKDLILHILHVSGARRCGVDVKGCLAGCVAEGGFNGTPEPATSSMLKTDKDAIFDEMLSAVVTSTAMMTDKQSESESILDMVDAPMDVGDRVLCLDGGGIRGLVIVQMLLAIEEAAGRPIKDCFDWVGGTSTGALLALGVAYGRSMRYMKGLYFRMKDEVFKGKRPYPAEPFEVMLKRECGETAVMTDIKDIKVMVTGVLADRHPADFHLFRNYHSTMHRTYVDEEIPDQNFEKPPPPEKQLIWKAARASGAAPTYFRTSGTFVDGGLMANNPTLDVLTEIHEYHTGLKLRNQAHLIRPLGCVLSLGTGRIPVTAVNSVDVYRPEGILDAHKVIKGLTGLVDLLIDQATLSEGRPVDRARAWCSMLNVPYFRFSPRLSEDVPLDCHDNKTLINMMWETQCYIVANKHRIEQLASLLQAGR